MNENMQGELALKVVQEEIVGVNEDLRKKQTRFFRTLNDIQRHHDDLITLQEQIKEKRSQYKKAQHAFDKVVDSREMYIETPAILPKYSVKKNTKDQILFDSFKEIFNEVQEAQELATRYYFRIWNSSYELLEFLEWKPWTSWMKLSQVNQGSKRW